VLPATPVFPGAVMVSEKAVTFVTDLLSLLTAERALRVVEHNCLDDAEKKGLIRQ
jgi:hypothetical protein